MNIYKQLNEFRKSTGDWVEEELLCETSIFAMPK
jgi:hypothetical protein